MNEDNNYNIRSVEEKDFVSIYEFVSDFKVLENYSKHVYKILLRYFGNSCFVAEKESEIIGFVIGFRSQKEKNKFFIWQIGVDPAMRGRGVGTSLLEKFEEKVKEMNCNKIELTVAPNNVSSQKLFQKCGYDNISSQEDKSIEVNGSIAVKDYYSPGRHFILFEKKL